MSEATVFVVDDDSSTRELLAWLMKRHGLPVEAFADARSFLEIYRPEFPGVLVLDLDMPGMSGLDLQQYLKDQGVQLPVIFLSGRADVPKAVKAVREGAIDFVEKPFDYRRIVALVEDCLKRDAEARAQHERKRVRAERRRDAPRCEPAYDLPDTAFPVDEDHVDRESHESRVNGRTRGQHQGSGQIEPVSAEQTAPPPQSPSPDLVSGPTFIHAGAVPPAS